MVVWQWAFDHTSEVLIFMLSEGEPPSRYSRLSTLFPRRFSAILNSLPRRLPVLIPVLVATFLATALGADLYSAWRTRVTPQDVGDAERVAFTVSNYINLDTLHPAETANDLATVALAGQNIGGLANEQEASLRQHVVGEGDTLSTIAAKYDLHTGSIILANADLEDTELIHPGQLLLIPDADAPSSDLKKELSDRQARQEKAASKKKVDKKAVVQGTLAKQSAGDKLKLRRPMSYQYQSQGFSLGHPGIDFAGPSGTSVYAVANGCVVLSDKGWNGGYGNTVILNIGGGYSVRYAHLSAFAKGTTDGACFEAGDLIAFSGNTGRSTGPHLHFEVRLNGVPRNPGNYGL
jgi:LysM repeat protein